MKRRFFVLAVLAILGQFVGALAAKGLFGSESFWAIEVLTFLVIAAVCLGLYYIIRRPEDLPVEMTDEEELSDIKNALREGLMSIRNITSGVEQVGMLYSDAINSIEKISEKLKRFSMEMFHPLNGDLQKGLEDMKMAVEKLLSSTLHLKAGLQKMEESLYEQGPHSSFMDAPLSAEEEMSRFAPIINTIKETVQTIGSGLSQLNPLAEDVLAVLMELSYKVQSIDGDIAEIKNFMIETESMVEEQMDSLSALKDAEKALNHLLGNLQRVTSRARLLSINAQVAAVQQSQEHQSFTVVADEILALSEEAAEAARQINKVLHEAFAKIEGVRDNSKNIISIIKRLGEGIQQMSKKLEELRASIPHAITNQQNIVNNTVSGTESLGRIKESLSEIEKTVDKVLTAIRKDHQTMRKANDVLLKFMDEGSSFSSVLSESKDRIEDSYKTATLLMETMGKLEESIDRLSTKQAERCNGAGVVIEETMVAFEQLRLIDEHLRVLEREARQAQRLLEGLIQ